MCVQSTNASNMLNEAKGHCEVGHPRLSREILQVRLDQPSWHRIERRRDENSAQGRRSAESRNKERSGATGRKVAETDSEIDLGGVPSIIT